MLDNAFGESRGRDLRGAGHLPGEVVRDPARPDRAAEPPHDRLRHIGPAELLEHHGPREDHAPGVHLVLPGVLGRGAVRRLEDGVAVAHVAAGREPQAAHLRGRRVGQQVAVQVGRRDHRVLVGAQHQLGEHRIGNAVLDDHPSPVPVPRPASDSGIVLSPNRCFAISYPHSRNPPSVNFMMLPLCTSVTERRPARSAYWIAFTTRRCEPNFDIGLMPMALPGLILAPNRSIRKAITASASPLPARYSTPEYTSSMFSRKITTSRRWGSRIGLGTPSK